MKGEGGMKRTNILEFDEVGYWSEIKLEILAKYAKPYNQILGDKFTTVYIDAFAGAGHHLSKNTGELIKGSPIRALEVNPPFDLLHFVDMDSARTDELRRLSSAHKNVTVHSGDTNVLLPRDVYPQVRYEDYRRGLCILDPYGLHLDWSLILQAGQSKSIEIFLNFPVMDMNMNVLWRDQEKVSQVQTDRMTRFWGDESWRNAAYSTSGNLFGLPEKNPIEAVVTAFQERLKKVAGFKVVPDPIPMRNRSGATVYYLFFAAHLELAAGIVQSIFASYKSKGERDV